MKYAIAYTSDGAPPNPIYNTIVRWSEKTWDTIGEALWECEKDGWRGYVCEYPSGARDWLKTVLD